MLALKEAQDLRDPRRLVFLTQEVKVPLTEKPSHEIATEKSVKSSCFPSSSSSSSFLPFKFRMSRKVFRSASGTSVPSIFLLFFLTFILYFHGIDAGSTHRHHRHVGRSDRETHPRLESYIGVTRGPLTAATYRVDEALGSSTGNDHKPIFTLCNSYSPEVYEAQPINTSVIQVLAEDHDPINNGGKVTYSIVEISDDFVVDAQTGWIRTNKIFDRDEPSREKMAYVSVRATDNGRPQLDDVCNLKVTIRDINDNRPMFDKFEYRESIPRDMAIGGVVMRISATDIDDGNNGTVQYHLQPLLSATPDLDYFEVNGDSGEVRLRRRFPDNRGAERTYSVVAVASDKGDPPESSTTTLIIRVVEPNQKPPFFLEERLEPIRIKELSHDPRNPVAVLEANSGIPNSSLVFFELLNGQTQATNKDSMFSSEASGNKVSIRIEKHLDYELVNQYTLSVRVANKHDLAVTTLLKIEVEDENDERPFFTDVKQGSVLENEPPDTVVMRVQAIDKDGTSPNNLVSYSLGLEYIEDFSIDSQTGEIRTRRPFDRESQDIFQLEVIARDGAPSAILKPNPQGLPNERREQIKIEIADKNDNPPKFEVPRGGYKAEIPEDADIGNIVIEVRATDPDTESVITYSIEDGDPEGHFTIRSTSLAGIISVQRNLDYEKVRNYRLTIKASDSVRDVITTVLIAVTNVNDNPPVFEVMEKKVTIQEEMVPGGCIFTVTAFDPDIGDRGVFQGIYYFVDKKVRDSFSVDPSGCVRVKKPLDRDLPNGQPFHQAYIGASDENGNTTTKLSTLIELIVNLTDINDNPPVLNSTNPVVWNENQGTGTVTHLTALDYDEDQNGGPFTYRLGKTADEETRNTFKVDGNTVVAIRENLDREARKIYLVPIEITDSGSPQQTGTSILTIIIGDLNDNPMTDGESKILVYKYKENNLFPIGRVFVNDLDDWDLPDKAFAWVGPSHSDFTLNYVDGIISMRPSVSEGEHRLNFRVNDNFRNEEAKALVIVTVKQITDEAVDNSGSIRLRGVTEEEFIAPETPGGKSRREKLQAELARILNLPEANVDVFTVLHPDIIVEKNIIDVRFSAHGSPVYKAEKIEGQLALEKDKLQHLMNAEILMIRVDECLQENLHCEHSCFNELTKSPVSHKIATNTSSFVGVTAFVTPQCKCRSEVKRNSCQPNPCLHDGICHTGPNINGFSCECLEGYRGSRCESTSIAFEGKGFAWYPPLSVCADSILQLHFSTHSANGLLLYNGPTYKTTNNVSDFVSLELKDGRPLFLLDFGSGVHQLQFPPGSPILSDGKDHQIQMSWNPSEISMSVDGCPRKEPNCYTFGLKIGENSALNVNGPLQLGGVSMDPKILQSHNNWNHVPSNKGFTGCISNVTLNGEYYDLGEPSYAKGNLTSCDMPLAIQVAKVGLGLNFIIILIVCLLVLLLLIIAFVFYRRRRRYEEVKGEPTDDIRENIINYSDEGGGEGDHGGYDLSVFYNNGGLPQVMKGKDDLQQRQPPIATEPSEMGNFLKGNKSRVDESPDGLPFDDLRNYAYEGDGNSIGSLSSLASGTDDEDLDFDYLPTFGPRFKKLADIYGGESSSDDEGGRGTWS